MAWDTFEWRAEWVHLAHEETSQFTETYGFAGSRGQVSLEGIRFLPEGKPSDTLLIYMHPASTLQLLPMPRTMAKFGAHVLCAASRYPKNDTALIMEKVAADLGAWVKYAREHWVYEKVVLVGWSGGGSLSLFYQSQAENPTIRHTPAGDPYDLAAAGLVSADAMIFQAAHLSRAVLLTDWIDPSVIDESNPDNRDPELDIYNPDNPNQPPYSAEFVAYYRTAQMNRIRRKTAYVRERLEDLKNRGGNELERTFITHRTMAEPRFLDPAIDPNDREPGVCYLGVPETVNTGPVGIGRFSTLRAWLSQWSPDDTNAHGEKCARNVTVPLLTIENSADDAVPQPHTGIIHEAAGSTDKTMKVIKGATHYYLGQKEKLQEAANTCLEWLADRGFFS